MSGTRPNQPVSILNTVIPVPQLPFLDEHGYVAQQWLMFFISLDKRTSDTNGTGVSVADVLALAQSILGDSIMEGVGQVAPQQLTFALDTVFDSEPARLPPDPLISYLIADPS